MLFRGILPVIICTPLLAAMDLSHAKIDLPANATPREQLAARVLQEEIAKRSQIRLPIGGSGSIAISLRNRRTGAAEGFQIQESSGGPTITGNDERGLLFGAGYMLRKLEMERGKVEWPGGRGGIETAPKTQLRGHQLGYRPKTNSYDAWTIAQWEQYIRELALFGANAIELIPPRSDDDADSPHFPAPPMETMIAMSRIADEYGLDVWIWYPALDADYAEQRWVDFALKEWGDVLRQLPRIDAILVPGGDPGHTHPKHLLPMLEKQAAALRRTHPKAQWWVAPQGFNAEWLDEFYTLVRANPAWLHGIVHGPQIRVPIGELRKNIPARYPIRNYPDITHTLRCQFPVPNWDTAFALTLNREPVNPRPEDMKRIFDEAAPHTIGFITYSEGCNDDVNKFIWSALGWDPNTDLHDALRDYARLFIHPKLAGAFAEGLFSLERNWRGPLATNANVTTTLHQFETMDSLATPAVQQNWRFQQAQYRAHYDAYTRARLIHETALEQQAMDRLRQASELGSLRVMAQAEEILERAITQRAAPNWRARTFELGEALFQSIRMQLSVPYYGAIAVGRGANLDLIDTPLNNRPWLLARFAEIAKLNEEKERLAAIGEILDWTNPGPGGFYDNLGDPADSPHLVRNPNAGPESRDGAFTGFADPTNPITKTFRYSWMNQAEVLFDRPLRMRYTGLDPTAKYKVRIVYAGERSAVPIRLVANGRLEVHASRERPSPPEVLEFAIAQEETRTGELQLEWTRPNGGGGNGRGVQIGEVWLVRQ